MSKSIVVFGAGPGLGRAVARRYGTAGHAVVLVARRAAPLESFAAELAAENITAHVVTADLSRPESVPALAADIRAKIGEPTVVYYSPAPGDPGFVPAAELTVDRVRDLMPMTLYTLVALVREFLPAMLERGDGAILSAQGAAAVRGWAGMSGWPPALAAQRNYLQSLAAEVTGRGVYVGMLFIGAMIAGSAAEAEFRAARAAGRSVRELPAVEPAELAELVWELHATRDRHERVFPEN